jgi:hypothetical protein
MLTECRETDFINYKNNFRRRGSRKQKILEEATGRERPEQVNKWLTAR